MVGRNLGLSAGLRATWFGARVGMVGVQGGMSSCWYVEHKLRRDCPAFVICLQFAIIDFIIMSWQYR